jgi:hypothetical protein
MTIVGLFCLPILAWLGLAATISTLRPPAKASTLQNVCILIFSAAYIAACIALGRKTVVDLHSMPLTLLGIVETVAVWVLVYLQLRAKSE